jgi:hypothetical protein
MGPLAYVQPLIHRSLIDTDLSSMLTRPVVFQDFGSASYWDVSLARLDYKPVGRDPHSGPVHTVLVCCHGVADMG